MFRSEAAPPRSSSTPAAMPWPDLLPVPLNPLLSLDFGSVCVHTKCICALWASSPESRASRARLCRGDLWGMGKKGSGGGKRRREESKKGQLINHGVPDEVICNFRNDMTEFFKQPLEAKKVYSMDPGNLEGYGQHFVVSENQKLDWADMFYLMLRPSDSRNLRFWSSNPPSFRDSIDMYSSEAAKLVSCLLRFVAMDMGVEPESLLERFRGQPQSMRMTYYPPCKQAEKVVGLSPHTDANGLTLLLQANGVQGLQIRKDGKWVAINALDGAFIVNVGDTLEILSDGRYKSVEHRAVVHPTKERTSAAVFHQPCQDATVGPLPELAKRDGEALYSSIGYMDFIARFFAAKLDGRVTWRA